MLIYLHDYALKSDPIPISPVSKPSLSSSLCLFTFIATPESQIRSKYFPFLILFSINPFPNAYLPSYTLKVRSDPSIDTKKKKVKTTLLPLSLVAVAKACTGASWTTARPLISRGLACLPPRVQSRAEPLWRRCGRAGEERR